MHLLLSHVTVDVERVLGHITQVLEDDEKKSSAADSGQIERAGVASVLFTELKTNHSTCVPCNNSPSETDSL